jgi:hypothetical protein
MDKINLINNQWVGDNDHKLKTTNKREDL